MRQPHKARAQSTVEFALVLPLLIGCLALLVGTTVVCLQFLGLHDAARTAARAAVTSDDPMAAARSAVSNAHISLAITESGDMLTVTATRKSGVWWFTRLLSTQALSQSVTMMREAPIVLG